MNMLADEDLEAVTGAGSDIAELAQAVLRASYQQNADDLKWMAEQVKRTNELKRRLREYGAGLAKR